MVIYALGLFEMTGLDGSAEIESKLAVNAARRYERQPDGSLAKVRALTPIWKPGKGPGKAKIHDTPRHNYSTAVICSTVDGYALRSLSTGGLVATSASRARHGGGVMPVYIDDAQIEAKVRNGPVVHDDRWSHLVATTPRELHDFATRTLGLKRSYFQDHWPFPHYDLTSGKRAQALANGAIPIEYGDPEALNLGRWLPPVLVTSSRDGVEAGDVEAASSRTSIPAGS